LECAIFITRYSAHTLQRSQKQTFLWSDKIINNWEYGRSINRYSRKDGVGDLAARLGARLDPLGDLGNGANLVRVSEHLGIRVEESGQFLADCCSLVCEEQVNPRGRRSNEETAAVVLELLDDQGVELVAGGD
ncbi:hypothetical protein PMAYCL1PPCAC_05294, partial [Pristionchus mayeri]